MASRLTTISDVTKKGGIVLGITVALVVILKVGFDATYQLCCVKPTPTPTPYIRMTYGVLKKPTFTKTPTMSKDIKINLETVDGKVPPTATISAVIYPVVKKSASLDYAEKSQRVATALGINDPEPIRDTNVSYIFSDRSNPGKRLFYDFIYETIRIEYDDMFAYISLEQGSAPSIEVAKTEVGRFLNSARPDLTSGPTPITPKSMIGSHIYINPTTREVSEVAVQSLANLTKINVARAPLGPYSVIGESTTDDNISLVYTGLTASQITGQNGMRLLSAKLVHWPLNQNPTELSVYPIRTADTAWKNLEDGKGYILSEVKPGETYTVRRIYMAYYEPINQPEYLQPVWVFDGDKVNDSNFEFRAIVPATMEGYVEE